MQSKTTSSNYMKPDSSWTSGLTTGGSCFSQWLSVFSMMGWSKIFLSMANMIGYVMDNSSYITISLKINFVYLVGDLMISSISNAYQ